MLIKDTIKQGLLSDRTSPRVRSGSTRPHAYASRAGGCIRQMSYEISVAGGGEAQAEKTTPFQDVAFRIGRDLEKAVIEAIRVQDPGALYQVPWTMADDRVAGIADAIYGVRPHAGRFMYSAATVVEVKTMTKWQIDYSRKAGPKREHVLQAAVSAVALEIPKIHLVYISKNSSPNEDPIEEWVMDTPIDEAEAAISEMLVAVECADEGRPAPPWYNGDYLDAPDIDHEPCKWCRFVSRCIVDGPYRADAAMHEANA